MSYPKHMALPVTNNIVNEFHRRGFVWNRKWKAFVKANKRVRSTYNESQGIVWIVTTEQAKTTTGHNQKELKTEVLTRWVQL